MGSAEHAHSVNGYIPMEEEGYGVDICKFRSQEANRLNSTSYRFPICIKHRDTCRSKTSRSKEEQQCSGRLLQ